MMPTVRSQESLMSFTRREMCLLLPALLPIAVGPCSTFVTTNPS